MCSLCLPRRTATPVSFSAQQFSASTRSAGLLLAVLFLLAAIAILFAPTVEGQTAHFIGAQTVVSVPGLEFPTNVAVDGSGNLYIADPAGNRMIKESVSATGFTQTAIGSGLIDARGSAVDASGNVYIADTYNNRVIEEMLSGDSYTQIVIPASGLEQPMAVAVDVAGNLYIADTDNNRVVMESWSGRTYTQNTIASGLNLPFGVAVDGSGNVYIADTGNNRVLKETLSGGSYTQSTVGSGMLMPYGVSVDASGNLYIADTDNNRILVETLSGGSYTQTVLPANGLNGPYGTAVDSRNGRIYIADGADDRLLELQTAGVNIVSTNVGTVSTATPLQFTFDSAGTLGAAPQVLTSGAAGLDFSDEGTGTCTTNGTSHAYAIGDNCTVDVVFNPRFPGTRMGAVQLMGSGGTAIATAYVHGIGIGPHLATAPVQSTLFSSVTSGLNQPFGIALDGSGNIYIADEGNSRVLKETPIGNGAYTQSTIGSGWQNPYGLTVDAAGNVYVVDSSLNEIIEEMPNGSGGYTQTTVVSGLYNPTDVVVDGSGNLYIVDFRNARVVEETPNAFGAYTQSVVASGLHLPWGVAVDSAGNVYITDTYNSRVLKETPNSSGGYTQTTVGSGWSWPEGIIADPNGTLYVTDYAGNNLTKLVPTGSGGYVQTTIGSGWQNIRDVVLDGDGNVYIADGGNNRIVEENVTAIPTLTFSTTSVGATSSDSPQTLTLTNNGNADLMFLVPASGTNPSFSGPDFTYGNSSTCPQLNTTSSSAALAPGASCTALISFSPTTGDALTESATLTDNNLNASPSATQTISLIGTGTAGTQTITFPQPATPVTYGAGPVTLMATASSGLAVTYTVASGPATVSGSILTFTGPGTVVVTASQEGNADYAAATPQSDTIVVTAPVLVGTTTAVTASSSSIIAGSSVTLTATVASTSGAPGGVVTFTSGSTSLGTATLNGSGVATTTTTALPVGADTASASYAGTSGFAASSGTVTVTVTATPVTPPSFTIHSASPNLSVRQGQSASTTLTLTPKAGYSGQVVFTCRNLPADALCIFVQNSVSLPGNDKPVHVGLTIQTNIQAARMSAMPTPAQSPLTPILPALAFWFPGSIAGLAAFGRKRKLSGSIQRWLQLCLLLTITGTLAAGLSGCNGLGPETPTGSSTVTVVATGTSGSAVTTQLAVVTVTVNK